MNYKAPDNSLHFIEPEFAHLLPAGSVPITDEEAEALRPAPPPIVITSVTMRQGRLALLSTGKLALVQAAIDAIPDETLKAAAQIEWEYAQTIDRDSAFTQQMAAGLDLTDEQLDQLFTLASTL
jgi:hypothetical protein